MGKSYIIQLADSRILVIHKLYININKKKGLIDSKSESDSDVGLFYEIRLRPSSDSESDFFKQSRNRIIFLSYYRSRLGLDPDLIVIPSNKTL